MDENDTALIKQSEGWSMEWIADVPGVNCQGPARDGLLESLREAVGDALGFYRSDALASAGEACEGLSIAP